MINIVKNVRLTAVTMEGGFFAVVLYNGNF
jgi:hypothetical protein